VVEMNGLIILIGLIVGYVIRRILEKKGYNMDSLYFWRKG